MKEKIHIKKTFPSDCLVLKKNVEEKINSKFKTSPKCCRHNPEINIPEVLAVFSMIILVMLSVFYLNYHQRLIWITKTKLSIILSTRRRIPIWCFDVASRVNDFNCFGGFFCLIVSVLLIKRHISYEILKISHFLSCNFQIILFFWVNT